MRDLARNMVTLWYVYPTGEEESVDTNGNYTSDMVKTYSSPVEIKISLYPTSSTIAKELFGVSLDIDFISNSNSVTLHKDGLLFKSDPISEKYLEEADYRVTAIQPSINTTSYGIKVMK